MNSIPTIEELLKEYGPSTASRLQNRLCEEGLTSSAARQRISRAKGQVKRYKFISLPKREQFLYLKDHFKSLSFWQALINAHTARRSAYGIAFQGILARNGAVPLRHFDIICGSPKRLQKHISADVVLNRLIQSTILLKKDDVDLGEYVVINPRLELASQDLFELKVRLRIEAILIKAVSDWARKIGFVSYNAVRDRTDNDIPMFGQFGWDITGPSYMQPISRFNGPGVKPGFFVADVFYGELGEDQVLYFVQKCTANRAIKTMSPFMAMLVAEQFSEEAFKLGKKSGILFTTFDILFGEAIAKTLRELTSTLLHATKIVTKNPEKIMQLLDSLSTMEGIAGNLRGALFEMVVGHLVQRGAGGSVKIGMTVTNNKGKSAEIDVLREQGEHEVTLYECKGWQPTAEIPESEIDIWLTRKIPVMRDFLQEETHYRKASPAFEYWTTGIFSPEAVDSQSMSGFILS